VFSLRYGQNFLILFRRASKLSIKQSEIQKSKFRCLSEATPYHHNVFTFTLFLPEGRAGVAWEPSNKMILLLPPRKIKCLSLHPLISSLNLLFIYPCHISLSRLQRGRSRIRPVDGRDMLEAWGKRWLYTALRFKKFDEREHKRREHTWKDIKIRVGNVSPILNNAKSYFEFVQKYITKLHYIIINLF
jgi:hypothetical protein